MGNIHVVGPSEALIVSGGCMAPTLKRTIIGGWAWAWWCVTDVQRLALSVMTLNPTCERVETSLGVPVTVTGVAQCKVMKEDAFLQTAAEQFLGKSVAYVKKTILHTLEGHLRAILGTLTVEEIYKDRDQFASLVREVASPDVGKMGIEILSFTIKDIYDEVDYLASLGKAQIAVVKRDARIGVAQTNRDAGIREAECEKEAEYVKYDTDGRIENNKRMFKLKRAEFDKEVNSEKAKADLAYTLQAATVKQGISKEKMAIDVVERRKQIEIEEQEIKRKEKELISTIKLPAEAEGFRIETVAKGKRTQVIQAAEADARKAELIGKAEAGVVAAVGAAEAEQMRMKAGAFKQYGDAAVMSVVLESLPKIAAEVSAPLAKTQEIVLLGGEDRTTAEVTKLVGQLPVAVHSLTGIDITKALQHAAGTRT